VKKHPPPLNVTRARRMRSEPTDAERAMRRLLRENFPEARFRRQVPLANAIADFASHRARLVVEVDGGQHDAEGDKLRDRSIESEGYRVLRFWNNEVLGNPDGCAVRIGEMLAPSPLDGERIAKVARAASYLSLEGGDGRRRRSHPHPTPASEQARKPSYPSPIEGEGGLIAALRGLTTHPGARDLRDDAAVLEFGGEALVLTHDTLVEGVHWLPGQDMADVAWKLVAVNLSDLAAKGAEPVGVLLGYMLGADDDRFVAGLKEALAAFDVSLLGGDTVSGGPPRALGLTAIGRATHVPVPSRGGARPGNGVFVTGRVGAAMIGFEALRDQTGADSEAYRRPRPLLAEGRALAPHVTAIMDVSDGLLLDARRLAEASGVTVAIDTRPVPIAAPESRRADALRWGDDYQLLFTAPADAQLPVAAYRIGSVSEPSPHPLLIDGEPPSSGDTLGFQHHR
jgi:thiamine-monophosphate kinase